MITNVRYTEDSNSGHPIEVHNVVETVQFGQI